MVLNAGQNDYYLAEAQNQTGIYNQVQLKYILQEYIWFNEHILIGNKPTYNKKWYQAGINTIHDLWEGNSILSKEKLEQKYHISCDFVYYWRQQYLING